MRLGWGGLGDFFGGCGFLGVGGVLWSDDPRIFDRYPGIVRD